MFSNAMLYLTVTEQKQFRSLPSSLTQGWNIEEEQKPFQDNEEKFAVRLRNMRLHSPKFLDFQSRAQACTTVEELQVVIDGFDLSDLPPEDLMELYFTIGPATIGRLIENMLASAQQLEELEAIAALSTVRHGLLLTIINTHLNFHEAV